VVEVSILYGSEEKAWLDEQVAVFNASGAKLADGSPIHVRAKPVGSGEGLTAIVDGTEHPTVFSPASSAYLTLLNQQWLAKNAKPVSGAAEPLALSPVVIAMWKPMAEALGWPEKPIGWADILAVARDPKGWGAYGRPEWGPFKLGHTNPEYSSSGLLSVLAIAYAGAKTTRGLTDADLPKIEPMLAGVEDSIVHYGKSTGFFADKLVANGPDYLSAAVLYENLVIESYDKHPPMPIVAIYPVEGTFWSDHPFSVLDAPWVTPQQREGALLLLAALKGKPAQQRALALGFRPVDASIAIGAPIDAAHGVDPKQPQTLLEIPGAQMLGALVEAWKQTKKPADVVLVLDKSGSMAGRPLDEAKAGAKAFLATLDPRDQITLEFFDAVVYPPVGPLTVKDARAELESRIDGVSAGGGTALYDATAVATKLLMDPKRAGAHRIRAIVVMTDGQDTDSHAGLAETKLAIAAEGHRATVFTIGYGAEPSEDVLTQLATAGDGAFSRGNVDTIVGLFRDMAAFF
jgi:Ca-activated chloride channel family protein